MSQSVLCCLMISMGVHKVYHSITLATQGLQQVRQKIERIRLGDLWAERDNQSDKGFGCLPLPLVS